jgi:hypothetical protein
MKDKIHLTDKEIKEWNKMNKKSMSYNFGYKVIGPLLGAIMIMFLMLLGIAGIIWLLRIIF